MRFLFSLISFWTALIFVVLLGLQWFPLTGVFLMFFAAPIWVGYIPHLIAFVSVFDLVNNNAPRYMLIVPAIPYFIYYVFFFFDQRTIHNMETELRDKNPSEIISYNPTKHSLVIDSNMTGRYVIPVSYRHNDNYPEEYLSHRLITLRLCNEVKGVKEFSRTYGVFRSSDKKHKSRIRYSNLCYFSMPEKPSQKLLKVEKIRQDSKKDNFKKNIFHFYLDDEFLGQYINASYMALPSFPKLITGCFLISSPAKWHCMFEFQRGEKILNTFPLNNQINSYNDWFVARLLKIKKYSDYELQNFQDFPKNTEVLSALIESNKNETSDDFDEWGLRKDSLYQPKLSNYKGYPSFKGVVFSRNKGGPFQGFIEKNRGQIVYLDIWAKPNASRNSFRNYGVCRVDEQCNLRTDTSYFFKNKDGRQHNFAKKGKFKGFFLVGRKVLSNDKYNQGDDDSYTTLTIISPNDLKEK